jgi:hypothetical protein
MKTLILLAISASLIGCATVKNPSLPGVPSDLITYNDPKDPVPSTVYVVPNTNTIVIK